MKPGHLGFSLLTHDTTNIDQLHHKLRVYGAKVVTPPTLITDDGKPYQMMMAKGPNEEMFEFTQAVSEPPKGTVASAKKSKAKPAKKKPIKKPAPKKPPSKKKISKKKKR
jgi:hypothetical protein